MDEFLKMEKFNLKNKTVIARVDINSPVDPASGEFINVRRIYGSRETIEYLSDAGAKVVILAHQGRPGDEYEFLKLEKHAKKLSEILKKPVKYVDDIFGTYAKTEIKKMQPGDIVLLENVRFYAEEKLNRPADVQARTHIVRELSPLADYYVNDAFASAHRSQPSLVGFTATMPSFPGKTMEKELTVLSKVTKASKKKTIFLLGGAKAADSLKVIETALSNGSADQILAAGLIGLIFLSAKGYDIGDPTQEFLKGKGLDKEIPYAKELLEKYPDKIELPLDLALDNKGKRMEVSLGELPMPYQIVDIGSGTIGRYSYILSEADNILANGPAGYFEEEAFAVGTNSLLDAIAKSKAFTIVGGGHLAVAAEKMGLRKKIDHISTAGGACILFLAGDKLPVIEALKKSRERFNKGNKRRKKR